MDPSELLDKRTVELSGRELVDPSKDSDEYTVVAPHLVSDYESRFYYHGISGNPPRLKYRSDLQTNPFPIRPPGARFFQIPTKTANGVFNTPLNPVWDKVAPLILASIKNHGVKYSALKTARFTSVQSGNATVGPVVIWIAVRPNTTSAEVLRDATPDILRILSEAQVTGVVVEWYEGEVRKLAGPSLMRPVGDESPICGLSHPFNTGLGIPIARQSDGAEGTLTFLFKEMKTSDGEPSDRILGLTNKHVACAVTTTDYEFDGTNPQHILVCGDRRLKRAMAEIEDAINMGDRDATKLERRVAELREKGTPQGDDKVLRRATAKLEEKREDKPVLQTFLAQVKADWQDVNSRKIGAIDWAPKISGRVDERDYTRDMATLVFDADKAVDFEENRVDFGNKYTATQLENLFWPDAATQGNKRGTIPDNLQLPIRYALPYSLVINPDATDKNDEPLYIVGKYGNATDLTLGRYSGMEAYTCDQLGVETMEVAVYNYSLASGDFSDHGDSGSLIFTGNGDALAMLHSGIARGGHTHVTFGTPIWWVMKQILRKYPFAEFLGIAYD